MGKKNNKVKASQSTNKKLKTIPVQENISNKKNKKINFVTKQYLFLFLLAIGLYANTLDLQYALDDTLIITENKYTVKGIDGLKEIFSNDAFMGFLGKDNLLPGGRYRPLSQATLAIEYEIFGANPFIGHLVNVLLYAFLGVFLFQILRKLITVNDSKPWYSSVPFLATLLFIAHPLHTEVVANIKSRDEILSLLFSFAALFYTLKYFDNNKIKYLLLSSIMYLLGFFSKENAFTFLAIIPLCLYFFKKVNFRQILMLTTPGIVAFIIYILVRMITIGIAYKNVVFTELLNNPFLYATPEEKYATIIYTWGKYFLLLIFPHPLTHDYYPKQIELVGFGNIKVIISLIVSLFSIIYALIKLKKKHIISFAILFFWLNFSVGSNLLVNIGTFMNERFMFAPLLGFNLIIAWLVGVFLPDKIRKPESYKNFIILIITIIVAAYSFKTTTRNRAWKNDFVLFTTDVITSKNSAKCNTSAGGKLMEWSDSTSNPVIRQQYLQKAEYYLKRSIDIYPKNIHTWVLLGNTYIKTKKYKEARECFSTCLKISPGNAIALNNLLYIAQVTLKVKNYDEAITTYKKLHEYQPDSLVHYINIGNAFIEFQEFDSAYVWFNRAIDVDSQYYLAYSKLGELWGKYLHNLQKAKYYLEKAIYFNPNDIGSLENLGIIYGMTGDFKSSLVYLEKALAIRPDNVTLLRNIATTYNNLGETAKAEEYLKKATETEQKDQ